MATLHQLRLLNLLNTQVTAIQVNADRLHALRMDAESLVKGNSIAGLHKIMTEANKLCSILLTQKGRYAALSKVYRSMYEQTGPCDLRTPIKDRYFNTTGLFIVDIEFFLDK